MDDIMVLEHMSEETMKWLRTYHGQTYEIRLQFKRLIGHIARPDYVGPPDDHWIHDYSDSVSESEEGGNDGGDGGDGRNDGDGDDGACEAAEYNRKGKTKVLDKASKC